jgi:hypothetical protein
MTIDELEKLADETIKADAIRQKGKSIYFTRTFEPQTVKQLIALVRLQHEALKEAKITMDSECGEQLDSKQDKAIAAFEQFGGE